MRHSSLCLKSFWKYLSYNKKLFADTPHPSDPCKCLLSQSMGPCSKR